MLLPAQQLLDALAGEFKKLAGSEAGAHAGAHQTIDMALRVLRTRENGGVTHVQSQFRRLSAAINQALVLLPADAPVCRALAEAAAQTDAVAVDARLSLADAEKAWRQMLGRVEAAVVDLNRGAGLHPEQRRQAVGLLVRWEAADLLSQAGVHENAAGVDIDAPRLQAYLRDRFAEPALTVTAFRHLPGGFGKLTYLFEVSGQALDGGYVMRRDQGLPFVDNDCHRIHIEYQVIRAARSRGFPAPEALWVDTEHRLLPGGDFLVMKRAPGMSGGSVFGATGAVPPDLTRTLAEILARLHTLPPMPELGDLTDSIRTELWKQPLQAVVRSYLENWQRIFLTGRHLPSPATVGLLGWLLDNIPTSPGRPVLLHGDIGFHNFIFDGKNLSAVVDWEFCHMGDPAEDLAYVRNTIGGALDWPAFTAAYRAAGGFEVSDERIRFFQVWGQLRNLCAANLATAAFDAGDVHELKMVLLAHEHMPYFMTSAQALIDAGATR